MAHFKGSIVAALKEVYPNIGLEERNFSTGSRTKKPVISDNL